MEFYLGSLDLQTQEVSVLNGVSYNCQSTGFCCKQFTIPVTENEIEKIEKGGYDSFQFIAEESASLIPTKDSGIQKVYFLKKKPFTDECVFLEENLCKIHPFKPLACRLYPFDYELTEGQFKVLIHPMNQCENVQTSILSELDSRAHITEIFQVVKSLLLSDESDHCD